MKISDALSQSRKDLDIKGVSNSKLDSLILLTHALSCSKEYIIFNPDAELNIEQQQVFFEMVKRRAAREPVSHIIGKREFYGEDFFVSCDVLDPRPDSESLIELVLKNFSEKNNPLKILELGVGSGCLIITLLKAYKSAVGTGVDISEKALKIAEKNATTHQVQDRLQLLQSDLFSALKILNPKFDLIISNPPYIASQEIESLEQEVKFHEPRLALDGGADGFDFYKRIALESKNFLKESGQVILEIGINQQEKIIEFFTENGFQLVEMKPDLSGIIRSLCFRI
ncbi:MAG: peptide chain release factor N(5)-glutamine methyltransferase [Pseudomonadota bacterium]